MNYDPNATIVLTLGHSHVELVVSSPWKGYVRGAADKCEWPVVYKTLQTESASYTTQGYYDRPPSPLLPPPAVVVDTVTPPINWSLPPPPPPSVPPPPARYLLWEDKPPTCRRELFPVPDGRATPSPPPPLEEEEEADISFTHSEISLEALMSAALDGVKLPPSPNPYEPISSQ